MFNPEIKERFLSEHMFLGKVKPLFEYLDNAEGVLQKDVAEMTEQEVKSAINAMDIYELGTVDSFISAVRSYVEWCRDNSIFNNYCGGFLKLSTKDYDPSKSMAKMFFRDEEDFIRSMRKVREFDEGYPEVIGLVFVWLGLGYNEATMLKDTCVDLNARVIYDNDGNVLVSGFSDGIHSIFEQFVRCTDGNRGVYNVVKDRSLDVFLKRMCSPSSPKMGTPILPRQLTNAVNRMNFQYEELGYPPRLSMLNVKRSGSLYRLWLAEQNGLDVNSKNNREEVERVYGGKKYRSIIWQYKYYKKAFNL